LWTDSYGYLHIQTVADPLDYVRVTGSHTSNGINVNQRIEQIEFADSTVWDFTQGLILNDTDDAHASIYGSAQNDVIHGNGGDDTIRGWDGDDTINGGAGADQMYGNKGDDTFVFEHGFGGGSTSDLVSENVNEGWDTLHFGDGFTPDDLYMWADNYGYLHIQSVADPQDYVRVVGSHTSSGTNVNQRIEQITFSDETAWDLTQGLILNDSDDAHTIYGSAQNDVIHGNGGDDHIRGWDGDDTINGGAGADQMYGNKGDDTFVFEHGFGGSTADLVSENVNEGWDTLHFGDGFTPDDLYMWTDSSGYLNIQSVLDPLDYVRVAGSHTSSGTNVNQRIEQITFSDETAWDLTQGLILNDSDDAHTNIYGTAQNDVIFGNGGNDSIRGWDGDDTLSGGMGSDTILGGAGADTFVFFAEDVGTGSDTLSDFSLAQGDRIDLRDVLDAGYDPITDALADFVQFTNSGNHSIMSVDLDGAGTAYGWTQLATIYNNTNLDPDVLVANGHLLAA